MSVVNKVLIVLRPIAEHLAIICLTLLLMFGFFYIHDLQTRSQQRARSICAAFEAYTNALIAASPPSATPAARKIKQAQTDSFEKDVEFRLSALHCDLHLIPVR